MVDQPKIRNFPIIAHIDHGKSTLSDRLIERCSAVSQREMESQLLDNMGLEQERSIIIKARVVKLNYQITDGKTYGLSPADMPSHVDLNYEVSRSLAACGGAVLIVDAAQGVEAQILTNIFLTLEHDLEILSIINKVNPPAVDPERVKDGIESIIDLSVQDASEISAKVGLDIDAVLEDIVKNAPAPKNDPEAPFRALIFNSQYDAYRGVVVYSRMMEGTIRTRMKVKMMASGVSYEVLEYGHPLPLGMRPCDELIASKVDYFAASIRSVRDTQVDDTVTGVKRPTTEVLPGYRLARAMMYCGVYIEDGSKCPDLRNVLEELQLNDASLPFEPKSSTALGLGFRCGFLGMFRVKIIQERLGWEFDLDLITVPLSVIYCITKTDGAVVTVGNPHNYPDPAAIKLAGEPYTKASIVSPPDYMDNIIPMCQECRGELKDMQYLDTNLVELYYSIPLGEVIYDFFDTLKAHTKGYASLDYELNKYKLSELVGVSMLFDGDQADILSFIAHWEKTYPRARRLCEKLGDNIPHQLFEVPIQAAIGGKAIIRETARAICRDVLAECYGGDITRKKKLLEKQKEGRKKVRNSGTVQIPTEVLMAVLRLNEE